MARPSLNQMEGIERMDRRAEEHYGPRSSLNAADLTGLNDADFQGSGAGAAVANPMGSTVGLDTGVILDAEHAEVRGHSGATMRSLGDGLGPENTLDKQGWITQLVYSIFCIEWTEKVFDRKLPLGPQMYRFHNIGKI